MSASAATQVSQMPFDPNAITASQTNAAHLALISLGLPPEIATNILDLAEYWCKQTFSRKVPIHLYTGITLDWLESSCLYLQTEPLGLGDNLPHLPLVKPQKVVFRIVSCDNDAIFSSDRERPSWRYYNNLSWFNGSIFREDESWAGKRRRDPMRAKRKVSPTWNFGDGRIFGRRAKRGELGENYALCVLGK
jgi:hypothetical protein